jgi:hypothetical protein
MAAPRPIQAFAAQSEYERQAAEARRRQALAEALEAQAYQPLSGSAAPTPSAAPLVMALQSYLTARQRRKGEEAGEKAKAADVQGMRDLLRELGPQERSGAETAMEQMRETAMPGQLSAKGTYTPSQITPMSAPVGMPYTQAAPTGQERQNLLLGAQMGSTPRAAELAKALLAVKPETEEFGTQPIKGKDGKYYLPSKSGRLVATEVEAPQEGEMTPYQEAMLKLKEREVKLRERTGGRGGKALSPTVQKEVFETDENILATETGIGLLKQARALSDKSFEGMGAAQRAQAATILPDSIEPAGAKETLEFDLLLKQQVLPQLRAIFGAAPTEGERSILLELQGSSSLPTKTRNAILDRALQSAERRLQFNRQKSSQLREGTYFNAPPDQLPSGFELE